MLFGKKEEQQEKKNTKETVKGTTAETTKTVVKAAGSAASIPVVGWVIALALLAAVGLGIAVSANSTEKQDAKKEKQIAKQQNTIYNTKKKNAELKTTTSEMEELMGKDIKTADDEAKITELADKLRGEKDE